MGVGPFVGAKIKHTISHPSFQGGFIETNGRRTNMEDEHAVALNYIHGHSLFAIFDGHGGNEVSKYLSKYFFDHLIPVLSTHYYNDDAIKQVFYKFDREIRKVIGFEDVGSAAIVIDVDTTDPENPKLLVMNTGDSKCLVMSDKEIKFASLEHNARSDTEVERVHKAGSFITHEGRVDGNLNLTRAFGDFKHKNKAKKLVEDHEHPIIPEPTISRVNIAENDFIFLSCDGIFEVFGDFSLYNWISNHFATSDVMEILDALIRACDTSNDNLSSFLLRVGCARGPETCISPQIFEENIDNAEVLGERYCRAYTDFTSRLHDTAVKLQADANLEKARSAAREIALKESSKSLDVVV